jgi:hypothetical protein
MQGNALPPYRRLTDRCISFRIGIVVHEPRIALSDANDMKWERGNEGGSLTGRRLQNRCLVWSDGLTGRS